MYLQSLNRWSDLMRHVAGRFEIQALSLSIDPEVNKLPHYQSPSFGFINSMPRMLGARMGSRHSLRRQELYVVHPSGIKDCARGMAPARIIPPKTERRYRETRDIKSRLWSCSRTLLLLIPGLLTLFVHLCQLVKPHPI